MKKMIPMTIMPGRQGLHGKGQVAADRQGADHPAAGRDEDQQERPPELPLNRRLNSRRGVVEVHPLWRELL